MSEGEDRSCPGCGTAVPPDSAVRWCGSCGARVRGRGAVALAVVGDAPATAAGPVASAPAIVDADDPRLVIDLSDPVRGESTRTRRKRSRWGLGAGVAVALAALVSGQLMARPPEVATPGMYDFHGAGNTGVTSTQAVTDLTPSWAALDADVDAAFWGGGPHVLDQVDGLVVLSRHDGSVVAHDPATGEVVWSLASSPFANRGAEVEDGRVPLVSGHQLSWLELATGEMRDAVPTDVGVDGARAAIPVDDHLVLTDHQQHAVAIARDGRIVWRAAPRGFVHGVAGGHVLTDWDGTVTALDPDDGSVAWQLSNATWVDVVLGRDHVALRVEEQRIDIVDATTGEVTYSVTNALAGSGHAGQPAVAIEDDQVLLALPLGEAGREDFATPGREVHSGAWMRYELRTTSGSLIRSWQSGQGPAFTLESGAAIFSSRQAVFGFTSAGDEWRRDLPEELDTVAATGTGQALAVSREGSRGWLLDPRTGTTTQELTFGPAPAGSSSPAAITAGTLAFTPPTGPTEVRWLDAVSGAEHGRDSFPWIDRLSAAGGHVTVQVGGRTTVHDLDGATSWRLPTDGWLQGFGAHALLSQRPDGAGSSEHHLVAIADGELVPFTLDDHEQAAVRALTDDLVVTTHHDHRGRPESLHAWRVTPEPLAATELWEAEHQGDREFAVSGDEVVSWGPTGASRWSATTGESLGRTPFEAIVSPYPAAITDGALISYAGTGDLQALDLATGMVRWATGVVADHQIRLTVAGDVVYVPSGDRVELRSVRDGELLDAIPLFDGEQVTGPVVVAYERVLVPTTRGWRAYGPMDAVSVMPPPARDVVELP